MADMVTTTVAMEATVPAAMADMEVMVATEVTVVATEDTVEDMAAMEATAVAWGDTAHDTADISPLCVLSLQINSICCLYGI